MGIQVNARLADADWERVVEALPGVTNAERIVQLVQQQLTLLDARRSLPEALSLMERLLAPSRQALREVGLRGRGSELGETLAQTVIEMTALLLSHTEGLKSAPEKALPELEAQLVQRWARATIHVLRHAALDPASVRHPQAVTPEVQRVFEQARLLTAATGASNPPAPPAPASTP